ncbi:MAG: FG-GAP-like repeat-containing protein, partial [Verrucomicrobiota bacterium]
MCLADLDNDGDLDVAINNLNERACVYRNNAAAPRVAVRLKGRAPNTRGIGAKIKVIGGPVMQTQEIISGGRYLSSDDAMRAFAAGDKPQSLSIEVLWRSGRISQVTNVVGNRLYEIAEPDSREEREWTDRKTVKPAPVFEDVSLLLNHSHHETAFDDFARQPTLPHKLSQLGPGVAWFDLDEDGWDDLVIGTGKGGQMGVFRNAGTNGFNRLTEHPLAQPLARDQGAVLGWRRQPGETVLLAGSANYEDGLALGSCVRQFDLARKSIDDTLAGAEFATGPMAMADVDGDGDLDLFVGGRCVPGKYPMRASSRLYRWTGAKFELDADNNPIFEQLGLVGGALFSDLQNDGAPDLILACEWGAVRVFRNASGRFNETTQELGLTAFQGWWNGVATGDFNEDGRLDIVASNWGRNSPYQAHREQPLEVFSGDFDGDGNFDILETHYDARLQKRVPHRGLSFLTRALPYLREQFPTFRAFAQASVQNVLGAAQPAQKLEVNWLESTLFLNRGDRFEARPLPIEAQFAPAFGMAIGDFDGDGHEDLILSQNFFGVQPETPRYDAGLGLLLRGNGRGEFEAITPALSGLEIYGEQRGAATSDFDGDGRLDLVLAQNGAATKLFRNQNALPGLRVRVNAGPGNPHGIGAGVRLQASEAMGPLREIQAGTGYWSQDSAVKIVTRLPNAARLHIRWPGGQTNSYSLP